MGTSTQSWKQEDRLETAVIFAGELSGATLSLCTTLHPHHLLQGWGSQARHGGSADDLSLKTWMEDFICAAWI